MNVVFGVRWNDSREKGPRLLVAAFAMLLALSATPGLTQALSDGAGEFASVIVRATPGHPTAARRSVASVGGTVDDELKIIQGFSARVPEDRVDDLAASPSVHSVTPNGRVRFLGSPSSFASVDTGSLDYVAQGATGAISYYAAGITGDGVDVALIDSGVVPVEGLRRPNKLVHGPDLSFESQSDDLRHLDSFGHGTHMAGIIAGLDSSFRWGDDFFAGVAPGARIVSVKVADNSGATDVSQVIAAIDWVVQHRNQDGLNIRVLNLSFGTDGVQDYRLDPLTYAAEVAWRKGIVVIAAAGNEGYGSPKLNNPAYDPFVLAVGASDPNGTWTTRDDTLADFSSRGDGARDPDLVAPGSSIVSLRAPGSHIDQEYPEAVRRERFFRGSGTSQAAAIASGAAALVLEQRPWLSPDQVKAILTRSAEPLRRADRRGQGAGLLDLRAARRLPVPRDADQTFELATGTGSLEEARGTSHVFDGPRPLVGERDIFGARWDGNRWSLESLGERSWSGGWFNGNRWSGDGWSGNRWSSVTWTGNRWSGNRWSDVEWSGNRWSGNRWSGNRWSGDDWSGNRWSGNRWSGNRWSSSAWGE